ncbi:MAG: thioesterase family protein [Deltaproteobacteria bacterium]|nr:thioesterase family protein [Deltaproteobacteria bacterium]
MRTFRYQHTVTSAEIDGFNHVNNAAYLSIFERARWAILDDLGTQWADIAATGVGPLVLAAEVSFIREVLLGETVTVETSFEPTSPRRFNVLHRMLGPDGGLRALGTIRGAFFNVVQRKIVEPPEAVVTAMGFGGALPPAPPVQGLGGAFLQARDVETLARWYSQHLSFRFAEHGTARHVELPSSDIVPSLRVATTTFAIVPGMATGQKVNFRVTDFDGLVARLHEAGHPAERGPDDYGRFATVIDPEGNRVELWEPPRVG